MNMLIDRDFVIQAVIVLGVCVGAWMIAVQQSATDVMKLEQSIAEHSAAANSMTPQTVENLQKRMASAQERLVEIQAFNELSGDSSRLYGLIMDLADTHSVQVQSLQPGVTQQSTADQSISVMRLDMTLDGGYEHIAAFVESVNALDAFMRPVALQITPTTMDGKPVATAMFSCDVLSFKLPEVLTHAEGVAHAQP